MAAEPDAIVTPDRMEANHCPHWEQVDWGEKHRRTQATQERVTRVLSDDFGTLTVGDLRRAAEALERHRSPTDYPSQPLSPDVFLRTGMREAIEAEARRRYERERDRERSRTAPPRVLVLAGDRRQYEQFIRQYDLSQHTYRYIIGPQDLVGYGWHNAVLIKVGDWWHSPLMQFSRELLDPHFPGWDN